MDRSKGGEPVSLELVTKSGEILTLALDSRIPIEVGLEAGEFFYDVSHVMSSVRCEKCGDIEDQTLTERGCLAEEWDLDPWADCETYRLRDSCPNCGSDLQIDIVFSWYNYRVRFAGKRTRNCSIVNRVEGHPHIDG